LYSDFRRNLISCNQKVKDLMEVGMIGKKVDAEIFL
jgi:hypothetical protein